ncbi:unnamed protein product [Rotaria magnacalcarata]|uniref:Uncharacterized protein n=1 Tax=Rotaria magnacalcarata TaxID=392030 RepID=A0A819ZIV2_9BILA|nr:unnamed protein product [Rotaria magnacalcarata]CAF4174679.1 unnamed protein product [Rotaria magnacalcarata]
MAHCNLWSSGRVLIAGDSRVRRLENMPDPNLATNVDFIHSGGVLIDDLVTLVDSVLTDEHTIIILVGFVGDEVQKYIHRSSEEIAVTLIRSKECDATAQIVAAVHNAHTKWIALKEGRIIVWTLPYYLDYATYNSRQMIGLDVGETLDTSWDSSLRFAHFITRLRLQWASVNPDITFCALNEVLFAGKNYNSMFKSFGAISGEHFRFPANLLEDGLHPNPRMTSLIWIFLHKCVGVVYDRRNPRKAIKAPEPETQNVPVIISESTKIWKHIGPSKGFKPKSGIGMYGPRQHPFYQKKYVLPHRPASVHSRLSSPQVSQSPDEIIEEEELVEDDNSSTGYGHLSWNASNSNISDASTSRAPLGTVQRGPPSTEWSWAEHHRIIKKTRAQCYTKGVQEQAWAESRIATMIREKGMKAINEDRIEAVKLAVDQWASNYLGRMNTPPVETKLVQRDLVNLLPEEEIDDIPLDYKFVYINNLPGVLGAFVWSWDVRNSCKFLFILLFNISFQLV